MSTVPSKAHYSIEYPTSDGKPMAETDHHRDLMLASIETLKFWFAHKPKVYVSGNLLMYYVPGNKRKHVSPDVFVVRGVGMKQRLYYLTWEEGKNPDFIMEITSSSTRREDTKKKFVLYRDVLKVKEYFLFDPFGDYLKPQLQGYRLQKGDYVPIPLIDGRMPSKVVNLHLEVAGSMVRLYDPVSQKWVPTPQERAEQAQQQAEQAQQRAEQAQQQATEAQQRAEQAQQRAEQMQREKDALAEETQRLREEIDRLRGQSNP